MQEKQLKSARKRSSGKKTPGRLPKVSLAFVLITKRVRILCSKALMHLVVNCCQCNLI
jgi:hypothetical protein